MELSKLKSHVKLIENGNHASWQGPNGMLYKHTVTFENGDIGTAMSTKEEPSWKVGTEYQYEKVINGQYTNIKGMKDPSFDRNRSNGGAGNYYNDPAIQKQITKSACFDYAIKYLSKQDQTDANLKKETIFQLQGVMVAWCFNGLTEEEIKKDSKCILNRRTALRLSVESMEMSCMLTNSFNVIKDVANEFLANIQEA